MSRVQGYGVLRQSYLPLYEDLLALKQNPVDTVSILRVKTRNVYRCLLLASEEALLNENSDPAPTYFPYFHQLKSWLTHAPLLQDYALCDDHNLRLNISPLLTEDAAEKERFGSGLYVVSSGTLVNRLKHVLTVPCLNMEEFARRLVRKEERDEAALDNSTHNSAFMWDGVALLKAMG